jgi:hypothetical protein
MSTDKLFILLLVVLLPLTGCLDTVEPAGAETNDASDVLYSTYTTITPTNERCGDYDVCVWEYAATIHTWASEGIEIVSVSTALEGTYEYGGSTIERTSIGTVNVASNCDSGHYWNNTAWGFIPTVGDVCQHDFFIYGTHSGSSSSNTNISEIQFSMTWKIHSVNVV